jgi:hypothetical protein
MLYLWKENMPFAEDKAVKLPDFLAQVHKRVELIDNPGALIFYEIFLERHLEEEYLKTVETPKGWDGDFLPGDFDAIYPLATEMLRDAASRNFSELHRDTYQIAHQISVAFCDQLNDTFECTGEDGYDLIRIRSYVNEAVEAGIIQREGNGIVTLTPEGERMAQEIEEMMQRPGKEIE